jgi:flagellar M-ring protein FliF
MIGYAKYGLVGLGALLFLFFMSRMLKRRENEDFSGTPTWLRELEAPRSLAELEAASGLDVADGATKVKQLRSPVNVARQQVDELIERDPDRVAAQVRQWMTED